MSHLFVRWFSNSLIGLLVCASTFAATEDDRGELLPFTTQQNGKLFSVAGSNTVGANLMQVLLTDYFSSKGATDIQRIDSEVENEYRIQGRLGKRTMYVDVAAHGSSTGFQSLMTDSADIAMSSRRIKSAEAESLQHIGDLKSFSGEHVIAIDGIAVIVNAQNPLNTLELKQIAKIFSGEITNWAQLGGIPGEIQVYARDGNSGTWDTFKSLVLGKAYTLSPKSQRFESNDELSDTVARDKNGIGFVGLASVREAKSISVSEQGTLPLPPKVASVATEDYALSRRLFLYTPTTNTTPLIREFISYIHSDNGQDVVNQVGFVSQNILKIAGDIEESAPEQYRQVVSKADRLSVNIRFAADSASLDNKAQRDILRLVDFMERPENLNKDIILVGFGDAKQSEQRAEVLSKMRAIAVKTALYKHKIGTTPVQGFGAFMPVADLRGGNRAKNQRVEIWVR
ncbi:substrate-binding domain-containing protein [Aurantivibrio plasticivorans]